LHACSAVCVGGGGRAGDMGGQGGM
jgi:hypothetical protein